MMMEISADPHIFFLSVGSIQYSKGFLYKCMGLWLRCEIDLGPHGTVTCVIGKERYVVNFNLKGIFHSHRYMLSCLN